MHHDHASLSSIIESLPQGLFWVDSELVVRGCNKAFAEMTGRDNIASILGKKCTAIDIGSNALLSPSEMQQLAVSLGVLSITKQYHTYTLKKSATQGIGQVWIRIEHRWMADGGITTLCEDITEHERNAQAIKMANMRSQATMAELQEQLESAKALKDEALLLDQVVQSAKDGVLITSADDINNGPVIIYANPAVSEITGYEPHEILGQTPRMLQGKRTDREVLDRLRHCLENGTAFAGELVNYAKEGSEYWLDISIVPIRDSAGTITNFAAIERDITARKKTEEELLAAKEKAESANQAKSEFLANMSHELRTPMNAILGLCEMLIDSPLNEEQQENTNVIYHSGKNLLSILNDILDISKIEAGELEVERVSFDVSIAVREVMQLFAPEAAQQQLSLREELYDLPDIVMGDLVKVQQILRNLINNALKFTDAGSITIIAKTTNMHGTEYLHFAVQDTGIGIPEDKRAAIFEKFEQADMSVTRKFGGTGLGLAICQQLAGLMGGEIGVESIQGKGSTFWFTLPLEMAPPNTEPVNLFKETLCSSDAIDLPKDINILAVDDHPINQMFVRKLLMKLGFSHIDSADNGQDALTMIAKKQYDIVLMDCQMPQMDGYQTTQQLRDMETANGAERLPVIALTANAMVGDREKCLKAGMDDYLSKPVKAEALTMVLKRWIGKVENPMDISSSIVEKALDKKNVSPVELNQLHIFTNGDMDEEKELLALFLAHGATNIQEMESYILENDHEAWKRSAHRMKGSAVNLGAVVLSDYCKKAEEDSTCSEQRKRVMLAHIKEAFDDIREFMDRRHTA